MRLLCAILCLLLAACEGLAIVRQNGTPLLMSGYGAANYTTVGKDGSYYTEAVLTPTGIRDNFDFTRTENASGEWNTVVHASAGSGEAANLWVEFGKAAAFILTGKWM